MPKNKSTQRVVAVNDLSLQQYALMSSWALNNFHTSEKYNHYDAML